MQYDTGICLPISKSTIPVTRTKTLAQLGNQLPYKEWGSLAWAESALKIEDKVSAAVKEALDPNGDRYQEHVTTAFQAVFAKDTPLKLSRFASLEDVLVSVILPQRVFEAKKAAKRSVDRMLRDAMLQLDYSSVLLDTFAKLDQGIRGCVIKHIIHQIKTQPLDLPEGFVLTEAAAVRARRAMLLTKLDKLHTATDKISHIEDALSVNIVQPLSAGSSPHPHHIPDAAEHPTEEQHDTSAPADTYDYGAADPFSDLAEHCQSSTAYLPAIPTEEQHDTSAPADTYDYGAADNFSDLAGHCQSSTAHLPANSNNAVQPVAAAASNSSPASTADESTAVQAISASTPALTATGELQMQALPGPQLSLRGEDLDSVYTQYAAALQQSAQDNPPSEQGPPSAAASVPVSPASSRVPESFPAQAPFSTPASSTPPSPTAIGAGVAQVLVAQIRADQESQSDAPPRPASPTTSDVGSVVQVYLPIL